jgi:hypothetical protein
VRKYWNRLLIVVIAFVLLCLDFTIIPGQEKTQRGGEANPWMQTFAVDESVLSTTGSNPYFILKPGYQLTLEGKEGKTAIQLTITVLDETKKVGGVETRVVEERELHNGIFAEVSRNYFAIHPRTLDVYYYGEDVDIFKNGRIANHDGSWLAGSKGAKFGLMMPGAARQGFQYYQEIAPGSAMDRAEIVGLHEVFKTPAHQLKDCVKVEETTPLEPKTKEYKLYAPGIGLVKDGNLVLSWYGYKK